MNVLHLTLKKKWFDLIKSGQKRQEYREITSYWASRLDNTHYSCIRFVNGYGHHRPHVTVELTHITKGFGDVSMGALTDKPVYILHLGELLEDY